MHPPAPFDMAQTHIEPSSPEQAEQPQRSRNARAQARHRAKRKAYIEKLEENVAKLQAMLGLSSEQVSDLPPAAVLTNRFAELEMENQRLHEQLRSLQLALHNMRYNPNGHNGARWSPDSPTVSDFGSQPVCISVDDPNVVRGAKKRKISFDEETNAPYLNGPPHLTNGEMTANGLVSRARHPHASVIETPARGHSADNNAIPFPNGYSHQANGTSAEGITPITVKSEPTFGDMSILSPTMAASSRSMSRSQQVQQQQQQQQQHHSNGPINAHMSQPPAPAQGQYRMSLSSNERDYRPSHQQHQNSHDTTYSGIVGGASRSIFGSDDESYLPNHPSPMDSRNYGEHQRQFLAHESLANLAERGTVPQAHPMAGSHQYGPMIPNRSAMPPPPPQLSLEMQTGGYAGGGVPSPVLPSPGSSNNWATVMAGRRA